MAEHHMEPELTDEAVRVLIGPYDGYDRISTVAVDYHLDGAVLYNYDTGDSIVFTHDQLQVVFDCLERHLQWHRENLERYRSNTTRVMKHFGELDINTVFYPSITTNQAWVKRSEWMADRPGVPDSDTVRRTTTVVWVDQPVP